MMVHLTLTSLLCLFLVVQLLPLPLHVHGYISLFSTFFNAEVKEGAWWQRRSNSGDSRIGMVPQWLRQQACVLGMPCQECTG